MSKHIGTYNILFQRFTKDKLLIFIDTKNKSAINQNYDCFNAIKQKKLIPSEFKLNPPLRDNDLHIPIVWGVF